jgi:hypothetical protein
LPLIRIRFQRRLEVGQSSSRLLRLHRKNTQIVIRIRVQRLHLQNGPVEALGVLEPTGLMVSDRLL